MKETRNLSSPSFLLFWLILLSLAARAISLFTPEVWIDEGTVGVMSLHAMEGEFPLFFYGQKFMGAMEAYLYGVFFHIVGPSPLTIELLPTLFSIFFILLTYLLAKRIFGWKTAQMSVLFLALPSYFLMVWTHEGRLHYSLILLLGNVLLLITQKIIRQKSPQRDNQTNHFIILGLIGGLGWWTNYLIVVYLVTVSLMIGLKNSKDIVSKKVFLSFFFFGVGSLPLWAFNFIHHSSILGVWESTQFSLSGLSLKLKGFFTNALPIVLGFLSPFSSNKTELVGYLIIGCIHLGALVYLIAYCRRRFHFDFSKTKGAELLVVLLLITVLIDLFTGYGFWLNQPCQRYLLPLYSVIPILIGFFIIELRSKFKLFSLLLVVIILSFNLWGNITHTEHFFRWKDSQPIYNGWKIFNPSALKRYRENQGKEARLMDFLKSKGYRSIYGEEALRKKLTFQSNETLIFSDPYQEIVLKYADMVDGASNPVYLFSEEKKSFEENLKAIGGTYQKIKTEDGFFVYGDFIPPREGSRMLPSHSWRGISLTNSSQAHMAFDGDVSTAWRSQNSQEPGDTFMLDLGKIERVHKLSWIPENYREVPVGYQVAVSCDGRVWQTVTHVPNYWGPFFWSGPHPMIKIRYGRIESVFPPIRARFIKIILTGQDPTRFWSINELFLFSPDDGMKCSPLKEEDITGLINFLKTTQFDFIYADHWLSALIRIKSNWEIRTLISNHYLDNNGEKIPRPGLFPPVRVNSGTGFIVENSFRSYFEKTLKDLHSPYQCKEFGPLTLYFGMAQSDKTVKGFSNLYWSGSLLLKRGVEK